MQVGSAVGRLFGDGGWMWCFFALLTMIVNINRTISMWSMTWETGGLPMLTCFHTLRENSCIRTRNLDVVIILM